MKPRSRKLATEWVVPKQEAGVLLQDFMSAHMQVSKRVAKQHIDARVVRVNGRNIWMARHTLKPDDVVTVASAVTSPTARSQRIKKIAILFEDADYVVVDKPAGMLTNGASFSVETVLRTQTGIDALQVSHRLDRDTTGCLLCSKTQEAHDALVSVFKNHLITKTYRTVVYGKWDAPSTTIDLALDGERALTQVRCIRSNADASHLTVRIETGRTHQIRRHLAMARHPVIGDAEYGPKVVTDERLKRLTHPLLHAVELDWEHPGGGGARNVFAPLPQDFHRWLIVLKLAHPKQPPTPRQNHVPALA